MTNKSKQLFKMSKNAFEDIIINDSEFKGKTYIDIRVWYLEESSGEYKPTKKGISIDKDSWNDFVELLKKVDNN